MDPQSNGKYLDAVIWSDKMSSRKQRKSREVFWQNTKGGIIGRENREGERGGRRGKEKGA